jgi:hypothetical protein
MDSLNGKPSVMESSKTLASFLSGHDSGDIAIIRVRTNYLVTMIPMGDNPTDLAVKLF